MELILTLLLVISYLQYPQVIIILITLIYITTTYYVLVNKIKNILFEGVT